ncbi:MAG TPA: PIG-L family deacetylase [Actinoplanes sp.]|nr:PIG-L family deacetylase [Actinoplanes sp.]
MKRRTLLAAALAAGFAALPGKRSDVPAQKVLWVWAHPDDETIAGGLSLRQHLTAGRDCYVLTLTRGTASGVLDLLNGTGTSSVWGMPHDPAAEGYAPLDEQAFGVARIAEVTDALRIVASGTGRTVTLLEAGLTDQAVTKAQAMAAIQAAYDQICAPGEALWLKTHTDILISGVPLENVDHTAAALACRQLAADQPAIFGNLRLYVEPEHWAEAATVRTLSRIVPAAGTHQAAATLDMYMAYAAWAPSVGRYAIGRQSVPGLWPSPPENRYHT